MLSVTHEPTTKIKKSEILVGELKIMTISTFVSKSCYPHLSVVSLMDSAAV